MGTDGNNAYQDFAKKYKVNRDELDKINQLQNDNITYMDEYLKSKDRMPREERNKAIAEINEAIERAEKKKQKEKRKRRIRMAKSHNKSTLRGKRKKRIGAFILAGIMLAGGAYLKNEYEQAQQKATVQQVLMYGGNLEELAIDSNILSELENIQMSLELNENLTDQEIRELAQKTLNLQLDVLKTKLSKVLGVPKEDIKLYTNIAEEGRTEEEVVVENGNTYKNKDIFTYENTIPSEVSDYIKKIAEMQDMIESGNVDRESILKMLNEVNLMAATELKVDGNGNISAESTRVSELNKKAEEAKAAYKQKDQGEER